MRILIIEDDANVRDVLRDVFTELGHEAADVATAEDALLWIERQRPDLILLDFRLPGMNGLDFLKTPLVRSTGIPIIVMSGIATERQAQECLESGAVNFLAKPFPLDQLRGLLEWFERTAAPPVAAPSGPERRRSPRARVALPVRVRESDGREWETTSVDLSVGGVKVEALGPGRPGPTVELSLAPPGEDEPLQAASVLIRVDVDGYVFYFVNLSERHLERLTDLVRELSEPPGTT